MNRFGLKGSYLLFLLVRPEQFARSSSTGNVPLLESIVARTRLFLFVGNGVLRPISRALQLGAATKLGTVGREMGGR